MKRSRKIVLLANCLLNSNVKVENSALYKGALKELVFWLVEQGVGIIQLPCPELTLFGIKRWGLVKEQCDNPFYRRHCRNILEPVLDIISDLVKNDYALLSVIGVEGSPSCGVNFTCSSKCWGGEITKEGSLRECIGDLKLVEGKGIFLEELTKQLHDLKLKIPFLGIDERDAFSSLHKLTSYLEHKIDL